MVTRGDKVRHLVSLTRSTKPAILAGLESGTRLAIWSGMKRNEPKAQTAELFCYTCNTSRHLETHRLGAGASRGKTIEVKCRACGEEWEVSK